MTPNCKTCIDLVLKPTHEGGYQRNPADPGNWTGGKVGLGSLIGTSHGISAPVLMRYLDRLPTVQDMENLPQATAEGIYEAQYWPGIKGDSLPLPLAMVTLDAEVMSGMGDAHHERAAGWLQEALGTVPDGFIGPATIAAAAACDQAAVVQKACALRLAFLEALPTWDTFGHGWQARVADTQACALAAIPDEAES